MRVPEHIQSMATTRTHLSGALLAMRVLVS
jgi:hypothetical protein